MNLQDLQKEIFFSQTSITISGGTLIKQVKLHLLLNHQAGQQLLIPKPVLKKHILPLLGNYTIQFLKPK